MTRHMAILPGGSPPETPPYRAVYDLLLSEARTRQWTARVHSFVGDGQMPDIGRGLELTRNAIAVRTAVREYPEGSTLFCRCYGCYVGAYLIARHSRSSTTTWPRKASGWMTDSWCRCARWSASPPGSLRGIT